MDRLDENIPRSKGGVEDAHHNSQLDGPCCNLISKPIDMKRFELTKETLSASLNNLSTSEKGCSSVSLNVGLQCKSIRIGSYKCNTENYKKDIVRFERGGMMLKIPPVNAKYLVKVKISRKNILNIIAHYNTASPLFFIQLTPAACSYICQKVQAETEKM